MRKLLSVLLLITIVSAIVFVPFVPAKARAETQEVLEDMYPREDYYHETLWIGNQIMKTIEVDRPFVDVQAKPIIRSDRTYVPMRFIVENLMPAEMAKTAVTWNAKTRKATFVRGSRKVEVWIGLSYILVNGTKMVLDEPAFIMAPGRTMMPLRAISEGLGAIVFWDNTERRVDIFASRTID
jgi:hypothetical protein